MYVHYKTDKNHQVAADVCDYNYIVWLVYIDAGDVVGFQCTVHVNSCMTQRGLHGNASILSSKVHAFLYICSFNVIHGWSRVSIVVL